LPFAELFSRKEEIIFMKINIVLHEKKYFFRENNLQERAYHILKDYQNFCKKTSCNALKCVKTKGKSGF